MNVYGEKMTVLLNFSAAYAAVNINDISTAVHSVFSAAYAAVNQPKLLVR